MQARLRLLTAALAGICFAMMSQIQSQAQTPVVTFVSSGTTAFNGSQSVGWTFDVLNPITVTGLSWYDADSDGLVVSHNVGIWNSSGQLLGWTLIPSGTGAALDSAGFRTVSVTPFQLDPGNFYTVGGEDFFGHSDPLEFNVTSQSTVSDIQYRNATYSKLGSGFTQPTGISGAVTGFYGPSFQIGPFTPTASVPEPGSIALLGSLGISGIGIVLRRRIR